MNRGFVLSVITLLVIALMAAPAMGQGPVFQVTLPGPGTPGFRFYFMYSGSVNAGGRFEITANAQHISGSGPAAPFLRITSQPSNLVFPLSPTSSEVPQYCDPSSCVFAWMGGSDQMSRIMRFQVSSNAPNGQELLLEIDASNGGLPPWVYVTDITVTVATVTTTTPPKVLSVSATSSPPTVESGKSATLTIVVGGLSPTDTATLTVSGPGVSQTQLVTGTAPMQIQVTPTAPGSIIVSATASSYQSGPPASITVVPPKVLSLLVSPPQIDVGSQVSVMITVGGLAQGDTATVTISGAGVTQTIPSVTGSTQVPITPTEAGQIVVTASATGYQAATAYTTATQPPTPIWIWILIGVIVVLVAVGIVAVFMLTRRKPSRAAAPFKPYYPTAPPPAGLKPAAPEAIKPAAHAPRVVARREEEKK